MNPSINTDVLVIGSGLSGATAAITAADAVEACCILHKHSQYTPYLGEISNYVNLVKNR